jgi:hypothetical protein
MTTFASHRLVDLFAEWIIRNGRQVGVKFACPSCPQVEGAVTLCVLFENPPDGGLPWPDDDAICGNNPVLVEGVRHVLRWARTGETLEMLTLSPSVDCSACGHWHGIVAQGEAP